VCHHTWLLPLFLNSRAFTGVWLQLDRDKSSRPGHIQGSHTDPSQCQESNAHFAQMWIVTEGIGAIL
jgi:hypothetical protein